MDKNICHFTLAEANAARKIVGKKQMSKIPELRDKVLNQAASPCLGKYVWDCGIGPQMGWKKKLAPKHFSANQQGIKLKKIFGHF